MQDKLRLTQIFKLLNKLGYIIELISGAICVTLFAFMFIVVLLSVFSRYIMLNPIQWTEELARFLMIALSFLAINIALRRGQHIAIEGFVQKLPTKMSKVLYYFVAVLICFFLIVLTWQGYLMTIRTLMTASSLNISMFWPYLLVPLGAFLTLIQHILNMSRKIFFAFE